MEFSRPNVIYQNATLRTNSGRRGVIKDIYNVTINPSQGVERDSLIEIRFIGTLGRLTC